MERQRRSDANDHDQELQDTLIRLGKSVPAFSRRVLEDYGHGPDRRFLIPSPRQNDCGHTCLGNEPNASYPLTNNLKILFERSRREPSYFAIV